MRFDGDRLNAKDMSISDWIVDPRGGKPKTLNGDGTPVVGVQGRGMAILDAVGLLFKDEYPR